jgi:hypothetical protein
MQKEIKYIVEYEYYHYNTGSADNGNFVGEREFDDFSLASIFANAVIHSPEKIEIEDGYITKYLGTYIVTKEKID